jgi:hypothetical protein
MHRHLSSVVEQKTKAMMALMLLVITPWPSLAQPARDDPQLALVSGLRACVRSTAPDAYASGIRNDADAIAFFSQRCDSIIRDELAKAENLAVRPGLFRVVIREEWTAFIAGLNGKPDLR